MTTTWTMVNKASGTSWTNVPNATSPGSPAFSGGSPIGLLLALTQTAPLNNAVWSMVSKATVPTNWTNVPKAT